jgi:hypothetical protein
MLVNGFDDCTQQATKGLGDRPKFLIERIVQQLLVHVSHEVDEALLQGQRTLLC